jgi:hypothetical protein
MESATICKQAPIIPGPAAARDTVPPALVPRVAVRLLFGLLSSPRRLILLRCKMRRAPLS